MYLRVTHGTSDPSQVDDLLAVLRDAGNTVIRQQAGFQNAYLGVNRAAGRIVVVSAWDTQEHAGYVSDAGTATVRRLQALGLQTEQPEIYEVTDQL